MTTIASPEDEGMPCPPWILKHLKALEGLTSEAIVARFREAFRVTVEQLANMGAMVWELERRKYDLSGLRKGMCKYIRDIAYGRVMPELVAEFQGNPLALRVAAKLPVPEQQKLLSHEPIKFVVMDEHGQPTHRLIEASAMTMDQVHQVIGDDKVRNQMEQEAYLKGRSERTTPIANAKPTVLVREKPPGIIVTAGGREVFVPLRQLQQAIETLSK